MKVSFIQPFEKTSPHNGYGYARQMCEKTLEELGHEVVYLDPTADVEINFIQPEHAQWSGCDYRIMYTPWESTEFPDGWIKSFNEVDEVWTPSPVIAQWMQDAGVKRPVHVYQHGVDTIWSPQRRPDHGTFEVLHVGMEALRKGAQEAIDGCMAELWDKDARLTMKAIIRQYNVHDTKNLRLIKNKLGIDELVNLFHDSSMLISPSWGEGFGLPQLQAMATGMPVLITKGWAPYQYLLPDEFLIESTLTDSPETWRHHHPGKMFKPDQDDLNSKLRNIFENRAKYNALSYEISQQVAIDYSWHKVTSEAFAHLSS